MSDGGVVRESLNKSSADGEPSSVSQNPPPKKSSVIKFVVLLLVATAAGVGFWNFGDAISFQNLVSRETAIRRFQEDNPILVYAAAFGVYVAVTGLSLPGASVLTLAYAWFFGFGPGLVLVSFSSTAGATTAFLISRYLLRDSIQSRFGERLASFNEALSREGAFYLFTMRLIPAIPFFVINVVMGLTPVRVFTFWWVSQVGMLPGTIVYVYTGSRVPDLKTLANEGASGVLTWDLLVAFVVLGLFPITIRKLMNVGRSSGKSSST
ncbi:MAG: TVP38/TMEM64 family protein [Planctomycetota bacterium]|nr:TVP38/TMEM64 family protein [Planctomycetota bacterium]MDA1164704.1 TVP38/TMEM64 family protein [Planctomycetota bacterium]